MPVKQIFAALLNWRTLLSLATSFFLIALFFGILSATGQSVNLETLTGAVKRMPPGLLWAYLAFQLLGAAFRALRYSLFIRAAGETDLPRFGHMYLVTLIRNMVVDMLPARLGELLFIGMLNRGYHVRANACISSLSLSILLDVAILVPVLALLAAIPLAGSTFGQGMLPMVIVVSIAVIVVLMLMFPGLALVSRILNDWAGRSRRKWLNRFATFVDSVREAFMETRRRRVLGRALLLTAGVRAAKYSSLYCLFLAITAPTMTPLDSVTPAEVLTTLIASEATASIPPPTFMSFGSYEAGGLMALTLLGYPAVESAIAVLGMHITSQFIDYLLGGASVILFYFTATRLRMNTTTTVASPVSIRPWSPVLALMAVIGGFGLMLSQYYQYKDSRAVVPPPAGKAVMAVDEKRKAREATARLNGFVVWSSNRYGNHDILLLSLPDWKLHRVTDHPHSEYFPRISPDGTRIVFARGQKPWVPHSDEKSWNVILKDLESGKERLLAKNANVPTWSRDGRKVYFQHNVEEFVELDIESGQRRVLFRSGEKRIPAGVWLQTPNYGESRRQMAVTFRKKQRMTVLVHQDSGVKRQVGYGCQVTWSPDESYIYWIGEGGRMHNRIMRYDPVTQKKHIWLDMPGEYSHEYFPKVSNTGDYMVFGASTGGHAHDSADYEIFLWPLDAPSDEVVRLSYHTGNDNWPDIHLGQ